MLTSANFRNNGNVLIMKTVFNYLIANNLICLMNVYYLDGPLYHPANLRHNAV